MKLIFAASRKLEINWAIITIGMWGLAQEDRQIDRKGKKNKNKNKGSPESSNSFANIHLLSFLGSHKVGKYIT